MRDPLFALFIFLTDRVRSTRGGYIFSLSVSSHLGRGGGTYLPGRGYLLSQVWMGGGGTYFSRSGRGGGVPNFPGLDGGGVPTFPGLGGGVRTFPGLGGGYLLFQV